MAGGGWHLASSALVKSTGFPFELVEELVVPALATATASGDPAAVADAVDEGIRRLRQIGSDERFLEAVLLSSRDAFQQLQRWSSTSSGSGGTRSDDRRRAHLCAMYLQRMCTKNESTSFFGPVFWAVVGGPAVVFDPGEPGRAVLQTYWTHWATQALADVVATDPTVQPELRPLIRPDAVCRDGAWWRVGYGDHPILLERAEGPSTHLQRYVLDRCDGVRTVADHAAEAGAPLDDVLDAIDLLAKDGLVLTGIPVPAGLIDPFGWLRSVVAAMPGDVGTRWVAVLDSLAEQTAAVSGAIGLGARRDLRDALASTFTTRTGMPAERNAGRHYADRSVLVEDGAFPWSRFDLGGELRTYVKTELPPVLDLFFELPLARRRRRVSLVEEWFTARFGRRSVPLDVVAAAAAESGLASRLCAADDELVRCGPSAISDLLLAEPDRPAVTWSREQVETRAAAVDFDTWCVAGADIFFAAPDIESINQGAFTPVVGEVHGLHDQLLQGLWPALHPERVAMEQEIGAVVQGLAEGTICDPVLGHWRKTMARSDVLPQIEFLTVGTSPTASRSRSADLTVAFVDDELALLCPRLGRVFLTRPPLHSWDDEHESIFAPFTGARIVCAEDVLRDVAAVPHLPRVTLGRTVVHRETWRLAPPRSDPGRWRSLQPENQTRVQRLWDERGLPDQVYAKFPGQPKPVFVDRNAPVLVDVFARHLTRATDAVTVTEMLPAPTDLWLRDHTGRHTSEFRFGCYRAAPSHAREVVS